MGHYEAYGNIQGEAYWATWTVGLVNWNDSINNQSEASNKWDSSLPAYESKNRSQVTTVHILDEAVLIVVINKNIAIFGTPSIG